MAAAADEAGRSASEAEKRVAGALEELARLAGERKRLASAARAAEQDLSTKRSEAEAAARALSTAEQAAGALRDNERLAGLLGTSTITPDTDTPALLSLLTAAIAGAEQEQTGLRIANTADQRVLDELGAGGLLPPAQAVTDALSALEAEGITAWSGWRYLATIRPQDRAQALATYPHLVDGIVLNNPDHLARAEEVLTDARLLPCTVVAVGATRAFTTMAAPPPAGMGFLVPPNPAMYDEDRAEAERQDIVVRLAERNERLTVLAEQVSIDRLLVTRLEDWQRDYPPGTAARLREDNASRQEALSAADEQLQALYERINQNEQAEQDAQQNLPGLRKAEASQSKRASRLAELAETTSRIPEWQQLAREARDAAAMHDTATKEHQGRATRLRRDVADARRTADDQRRVATASRDELRRIPGAGAADASLPVPPAPVTTLRDAYETAKAAYDRAAVGIDLREGLERAEAAEAGARASVEALDPGIRVVAGQLLGSPDGADAPARAAATARASRIARACEEDYTSQAIVAGQLKADYERLPPQEVMLEPPYDRPASIGQAVTLVGCAETDWNTARRRYDDLHASRQRLDSDVAATQAAVNGFQGHLFALAEVQPASAGQGTIPFDGTVDMAGMRLGEVMGQVREAGETFSEAESAVRKAADALARYATDQRFEQVKSLVRRQIINVNREQLPSYAAEWEAALRPRLRSLIDELAQLNRHHSAIITRLRGMVGQALTTLRTARKLSALPDGLGEWSGQEFLRIKFDEADPSLLEERLGAVIDDATSARTGDKGSGKRDGLTLLLRGVRAAMPRGVKVDMLKPDAVLRTERVPVAEIGDVFSGGQLLTAAIILYCTMAALRANDRGHARRLHAGVLFLDNPIGRASAGYLLELQMAVAEALGVQLVYTTGLFDTNALSVFPLIIRLRNDADLRAGLKYLTIDDTIYRPLAALGEPDDTGRITSTRIYSRPPAPARGLTA